MHRAWAPQMNSGWEWGRGRTRDVPGFCLDVDSGGGPPQFRRCYVGSFLLLFFTGRPGRDRRETV